MATHLTIAQTNMLDMLVHTNSEEGQMTGFSQGLAKDMEKDFGQLSHLACDH